MPLEQQKAKILACVEARGWAVKGVYAQAARELESEGKIKHGEYYSVGGNRTPAWVRA